MALADPLWAGKKLTLWQSRELDLRDRHRFVGSLFVPKGLSDGRFPVVDVWVASEEQDELASVHITPYAAAHKRPIRSYFGVAHFDSKVGMRQGTRWLRIHTLGGVKPQGHGFGFILYAAAALASRFVGAAGIFSPRNTGAYLSEKRTDNADEVWQRLRTISFGPMRGALAYEGTVTFDGQPRLSDYLPMQKVLDSGLVVRLRESYGQPWAHFHPIPADAKSRLALDYPPKK